MIHALNTRASKRVAAITSARASMRRTSLGLAAGLVLAATAATGLVAAAPAAATPSVIDVQRAAVAERDGRLALTNAQALNNVVTASGLRDRADLPAVDLTALKGDVLSLTDDELTASALDERVDDTVRSTVLVQQDTAELLDALTAAKEAKAAEEERKRAEAARIAAEKAAEEKRQAAAALAAANTVDGAKATARRLASERYGWGGDQFSCLSSLWNKESSWNYQAYNASSGATGIPQALPGSKMATAGSDWKTNAATQISWGLDYIKRAYGTPCAAWGHSQAVNWY